MHKKKGVTMIEAMGAMTLLSLSVMGFLKLQGAKLESELNESFKYDFQKIIKGFEEKIYSDKLIDKKYWRDFNFTNGNFREHLKHNLINSSSNCADPLGHPNIGKDYIPCFLKLNIQQFKTNFSGKVRFNKHNEFKYYMIIFKPKNLKGIQKLPKLNKTAKYSLNDSDFYSNIDYVANKEIVSYMGCVNKKDLCSLRISFGTDYDYLENEKNDISEIEESGSEMISYDYGYDNVLDDQSDYNNSDTFELDNSGETEEDIMNILKKNGIKADYEEVVKVKKHIKELSKNPDFVKEVEAQMINMCDQYDDDDYYFMELYDQDHICYRYKTEQIK